MKKLSLLLAILMLLSFTACSTPGFSAKKVKKEYFTNGQVRTEFIMDDDTEKNGLFKKYGYNGNLTSTVPIKNGVKDGIETWYDGQNREIRKVPYLNGSIHGTMTELYPNGDVMVTIPFQYGSKQGVAQTYNKDGSVNKRVLYRNGKITN
jgi:antitoxin component YwqK of YwqJK toxin-antitoxin module